MFARMAYPTRHTRDGEVRSRTENRQAKLSTDGAAARRFAALLCGSAHPAALLRLGSKGRLTPGADADLVLLDPANLRVRACFVGGRLAWAHPKLRGSLWYYT